MVKAIHHYLLLNASKISVNIYFDSPKSLALKRVIIFFPLEKVMSALMYRLMTSKYFREILRFAADMP